MSRRLPLLAKFVLLGLLTFAAGSHAIGDTNPVAVSVPGVLHWTYAGVNRTENLLRFDFYDPDAEGWCTAGCQTTQGTKYEHFHITTEFPYWSQQYGYWVTAEMTDVYWDAKFSAYQNKIMYMNQTFNCHGYSTGYSTSWIAVKGMQTILEEEYEDCYALDAVLEYKQISEFYDHSKKIFDLFDAGGNDIRVGRIREKNLESGVYEKVNMQRSLTDGFKRKPPP